MKIKKIIILGVIITAFLMLVIPCVNAINTSFIKERTTKLNYFNDSFNNVKNNNFKNILTRVLGFLFWIGYGVHFLTAPDVPGTPKTGLGPRLLGCLMCWWIAIIILAGGEAPENDFGTDPINF